MSRRILIKVVYIFFYIEFGLFVIEKKRELVLYGIFYIWLKRVYVKLFFVLMYLINCKLFFSRKYKFSIFNMKDYVKIFKIL